nr:cytochrome P450 [Agasicles hygrophila]UYD61983.1 cytochrome P450 314A1 [Agasicles hygrophila]
MIDESLYSFNSFNYIILIIVFIIFGYRPPWFSRKSVDWVQREIPEIPGPLALPILGTTRPRFLGGFNINKIHEYYLELYKKYGPIVKEEALFNVPVISVFEKSDIEKVLKSCGGKYPMRPPCEAQMVYRRSRPDRYVSTGLVNEQGPVWHHLRTSLTTDLTSPKTISGFLPQAEEISEDWCNLLRQTRTNGDIVEHLEDLVNKLGLETSCSLVLGRRLGFLLPGQETNLAKRLADAVHSHFIATRDTYYGLPFWKLYNTSAFKKLADSEETIYKLASELIQSADDATAESSVFQSIIKADIDEREKTAAIIDFIAAGIHTLKNSLVFILYLVGRNAGVQQKILEDKTKSYLKACIRESFRIYPTAYSLARITQEDLDLSGFKVKGGSVVICHTGVAGKNAQYFKDPLEFRPERWLGAEKSSTASNATFLVTPFGAGKRICPGKRLMESVLPIFLENTVKNFEIDVVNPMEIQFEFLLAPKGPTSMIFRERV